MSDHELRLRIRLELRRMAHGLDRGEALEAIMDAIRERKGEECARRTGQTLH